ncbi:MAG: septum formation family protein [Arthrobacter sp.]
MTEENERRGEPRMPGVPPAAGSGGRSTPAAPPVPPSTIPPKPSALPTSATPVVPAAAPPAADPLAPAATPAPARPTVPPVNGPDAGRPHARRSDTGQSSVRRPGNTQRSVNAQRAAGAAAGALAGASKVASERASQLGGWLRRQAPVKIGAAVTAVVVMGLLIWWLTSLGGSDKQAVADTSPAPATSQSAPASRGPLPLEGVGPLDFQAGDCFKDFDPEAPQSTIVDCGTGHSAQLIAVHNYQKSDAYPGLAVLKEKGRETCRSAQLAAAATNYALKQRNAYPSSTSWDNGDRRVDCYVTADGGNIIMESLVP